MTTDLKICVINPGFHNKYNEALTSVNMAMTTMDINYLLVTPNSHSTNNVERAIQTFKNHFIEVLFSVDENVHLQL